MSTKCSSCVAGQDQPAGRPHGRLASRPRAGAGRSAGWAGVGGAPGRHVVVLHIGHLRLGCLVHEVIGREDVMVKPLGHLFEGVPGVAGATVTGDGRTGAGAGSGRPGRRQRRAAALTEDELPDMDLVSLIGTLLAFLVIVAGHRAQGLQRWTSLWNPAAFLIVFAGHLRRADGADPGQGAAAAPAQMLPLVYKPPRHDPQNLIRQHRSAGARSPAARACSGWSRRWSASATRSCARACSC